MKVLIVDDDPGVREAVTVGIQLQWADCEFVVSLPGLRVRPEDNVGATGGRKILVVDDNVDAADSLALVLQLDGHEIRVAYDGLAALQMAAAFPPPPEIVLMDIGMPYMDGYEAARRLRHTPEGEHATLVATRVGGQEADVQRARDAGFDQHLIKPVEPEALQHLLARTTGATTP